MTAAVELQQDNLEEEPVLISDMWFHGGRIVIEPGNLASQQGVRTLVDKIKVKDITFVSYVASEAAKTASISLRVEASGNLEEMILGKRRGIIRLNKWQGIPEDAITIIKGREQPANKGP